MKRSRSKMFALIAVFTIAAQLLAACGAAPMQMVAPVHSHSDPYQAAAQPAGLNEALPQVKKIDPLVFQQSVRKLWEDHVTWTRVYIIAALAGLPEADTAAGRLLQNQTDIGNAIKPFYGEQAGDQLTALLRDHILTAAELLAAAKAGDTAKFQDASARWYANADEIAAFLSSANPDNWPLADMQAMMKTHLDLTLAEASARLKSDWPGDVAAYDQVHDEILQMAGMLTDGIVAQFPDKFK